MPELTEVMNCPECGVPMNFHAERALHPAAEEEVRRMDPALDGALAEFHTCPECGQTHSRHS